MPNTKKKPYQELVDLSKKIHLLTGTEMILSWDQEIFMPKAALEVRTESSELLASIIHKEKTSTQFQNALSKLIDLHSGDWIDNSLSDEEQASVREMRRDFLRQIKLPEEFVKKFAYVTSYAHHAWIDARKQNKFSIFQPYLEKIIELNKQRADYIGYDNHPYDALIESYEPETEVQLIKPLFEKLKFSLTNLVKKIQTNSDPLAHFFCLEYDHDAQLSLGKIILEKMGLSEEKSRLDESIHPMCLPIHPNDIRMTTRIYSKQVYVNILSCLHEGGHGLYHSNLPIEKFGTPLSQGASYGIDESQSRTWETIIGRSYAFLNFIFPKMQELFYEQLQGVSLDDFYRAINTVEPSLIRVDSDEVTYNLHIITRFEIELALIEGSLQPRDVPKVWNEMMLTNLGIEPKADSEGCLQDIHWSMGAIGYFPTYTLGNLYSAQFFEAFKKDHTSWKNEIGKGNLKLLASWQKEKIHRHGRRYLPNQLCQKITGESLSEKPFIRYLVEKYSAIYNF